MSTDVRTLYVMMTANAATYRAAMRDAGQDTRKFGDDVEDTGRRLDQQGAAIDRFSGRLGLAAEALTILGPATIPIGAVAIPALTSLISIGTIAAATLGSVMIAVQGMGDAFKAVEEYEADPTADNLEKVRTILQDLAPAAAMFVLESQDLVDGLGRLQEAAADRFFGNTLDELDELEHMLPSVRRLFVELATVASEVTGMGVDDFDSRSTREFFRFLKTEAQPTMTGLYQILRNVAGSFADVWMAMDPMNDDFLIGLVGATQDLREWSEGLDQTEGYADFMDYVRENGPKVTDALGAIANAALQVVEAASPLGGPVLEALEFVADAVATIADSQFGPRIVTGAAAFLLLNRALSMTTALLTKTGLMAGGAAAAGAAGAAASAPLMARVNGARTAVTSLRGDVRAMSREYAGMNRVQSTFISGLSATTGAAQRTRASLAATSRTIAGGALASGAFALAATEQGRALGFSNTAMLGLMGSMKGPWGAAIGVSIGALIDFANANDEVRENVESTNAALLNQAATFTSTIGALKEGMGVADDYLSSSSQRADDFSDHMRHSFTFSGIKENLDVLNGGAETSILGETMDAYDEWMLKQGDLQVAGAMLAKQMGVVRQSFDNSKISTEEMDEALQLAAPAMRGLGISFQDFTDGVADGSILEMSEQIAEYQRYADSGKGRTDALADAIDQMGADAMATAASAAQLGAALADLIAPQLNAEAATDAWRQSLREMRRELNDDAGFEGYRQAAVENREITREYAATAIERLTALAGVATTTEEDMAAAVGATRREFIASGIEAGISRKEIERRANELRLTPKLVRTAFEAAGITKTQLQARRLREAYDVLPKQVRTALRADGIPKTKADVDALVEKYEMTGQERRALVTLMDLASPQMRKVLEQLGLIDRASAEPSVGLQTNAFSSAFNWVTGQLSALNGRTATTYIKTVRTGSGQGQKDAPSANGSIYVAGRRFADGGFAGGGAYHSRIPQIVKGGANILWGEPETGWEAYISGKPSMRDRNVSILGQAAHRLGMNVTPRQFPSSPAGGRTVIVKQTVAFPGQVRLNIGGREFVATVEGIAQGVAAAGRASDDSLGRMSWT